MDDRLSDSPRFGTVLGVLYGVAFEAVGRAGPLMGAGLGLANGLLAGMMMTSIPAMNPFGGAGGGGGTRAFLAHVHYVWSLSLAAMLSTASLLSLRVSGERLLTRLWF